MTNITQEDREAAARWYHVNTWLYRLLTGAFALHREAAEAKERERIVKWLRDPEGLYDFWHAADLIEAGEHMEANNATSE